MKNLLVRPALVGLVLGGMLSWQAANAELLMLLEGDVDSGAVAVDSSGKGNHGIYLGSAGGTADGQSGGAINFNADESYMVLNRSPVGNSTVAASPTSVADAFAGINASQEFSIGYWMAGGDTNPRNSSTFWAQGVTPNGGNRGIQSHATWSNSNIYLDIGGCCAGTSSRLNGVLEDEHIRANEGETWSHIAYTAGIDPETEEYTRRIYVNGEIYGFGGDPNALAETITDGGPLAEGEEGYIPIIDKWNWGSDNNEGNQWEGRMDDVFVTDHMMSPAEMADLYSNGARAFFGIEGTPEPVTAQFIVANDDKGSYGLSATVSNEVFSEPMLGQGLAQYWYEMPGAAPADGVIAFQEARIADDGSPGGTADYPLVAGGFLSGQWVGGQDQALITGQTIQRYPSQVAGVLSGGGPDNHDNYGVIAQGEIFIPENGTYIIRDGIDDYTMIAIDANMDGEISGLDDLFDEDLGILGIGLNLDEVYVFDNDWSNADGSGNIEAGHAEITFDNIPADGAWVKMELWMSEGGGGDAGIIYLANEDDPDLFDVTDEAALTQEQRDKFIVPAENLRGVGVSLLSADATAELASGLEYILQVGADGTHDSLDIDDNGGLYSTTLDVSGGMVTIETEEGVEEGTEIQIFGAHSVVGLDSLTLNADGWNTSKLGQGILVFGAGGVCDPNSQGDLDGNGTVEFADFLILSGNFGNAVGSHAEGDIDCNGTVEFADFLVLSGNFGNAVGGAESVPEPSSMLLISLAAMLGLGCRRRR